MEESWVTRDYMANYLFNQSDSLKNLLKIQFCLHLAFETDKIGKRRAEIWVSR